MQKRGGNPALIGIVIGCAVLSGGLIFWSSRQRPANDGGTFAMNEPAQASATPSASPAPVEANPSPAEQASIATDQAPDLRSTPAPSSEETPNPASPTAESGTGNSLPSAEANSASTTTAAQPTVTAAAESTPAAANPQPTPEITASSIASNPRLWPTQVIIQTPVRFPVYINGTAAGSVLIAKGNIVNLHKVSPDGSVELERLGAIAKADASATDLLPRARTIAARLNKETTQASTGQSEHRPESQGQPSASPGTNGSVQESNQPNSGAVVTAATPTVSSTDATLSIAVTRDRKSDPVSETAPQYTWQFHLKVSNPTPKAYSNVHGTFLALYRDSIGLLRVAANQAVSGNLAANGDTTIDPSPVRADQIEGYAVVLRDSAGNIVAQTSTRDSLTRNWPAAEKMAAGDLVNQ